MDKVKVYIAGPMRGKRDFNYPAFDYWATRLRVKGVDVVNPAAMGRLFGTPEEINAAPALLAALTEMELHELGACDAIMLLPGWQNSIGARKELALALQLGLDIYPSPTVFIKPKQGEQP